MMRDQFFIDAEFFEIWAVDSPIAEIRRLSINCCPFSPEHNYAAMPFKSEVADNGTCTHQAV
jgi:hypothetical protein